MQLRTLFCFSRLALVTGYLVMLTGCAVEELDLPVFPAANAVSSSNANKYSEEWNLYQGQLRFLWGTWGAEQLQSHPPAEFLLQLMQDEPEVFGDQFAQFGFISDPTDEFPIGFKRGSVDNMQVHETCAMCHVAYLPDGRLWIGAPNSKLDWNRFRREVNERWVLAGNSSLLTELQIEKSYLPGPGRTSVEKSDAEVMIGSNFPPYFNFHKRNQFNYTGSGREPRAEIALSLLAFGVGRKDGVPFPSEYVFTQQLVRYMSSLTSPDAPQGETDLLVRGREVFDEALCDQCHHIGQQHLDRVVTFDDAIFGLERLPGEDPAFPNGSIQTDKLRFELQQSQALSPGGYLEYIIFVLTRFLKVMPTDGYRAVDLSGIWATAPYLHNGSIPTLRDLLEPAFLRPIVFEHEGFIFDTRLPGNSNHGHEFGIDLSDSDKNALVNYLKSL